MSTRCASLIHNPAMSTDAPEVCPAIVADTGLPDENWETFTEGKDDKDVVTKLLHLELMVERVRSWHEGIDHHGHNHTSMLTWLGENLDKDMNDLKGNLNDLKGNQELLMAQVQQLAVKMARQAMLMEHVLARQGQLEHLVERIDQRRRDEEHDEALERAMNSRGS